jgi:hypothetical protein
MPDPRGHIGAQPQFPPPGYQGDRAQALTLDPNAPAYQNQPQYLDGGPGSQVAQVEVETQEYGDYFGFDEKYQYYMPDGKQWIEFKALTEGDLGRYQKLLKRDITVEKDTGNARIKIDQVEERHALLMVAVTNWFMLRRNQRSGAFEPQTFSTGTAGSTFAQWLERANPAIIADLAEQVRKQNPYLLGTGNETIEAIDKQIEQLVEQRKTLVERQQGEGASANS